jgi:uncharacterized membrane protein YdbT with pleckstrin-like domain
MKCPSCGAEANPSASFCQVCGAKLVADGAVSPAITPAASLQNAVGRQDEPEAELWSGGFSPKAMIGSFFAVALVTVLAIVLGLFLPPEYWWWPLVAAFVLWLLVLGQLAYRRMNIHYRLTSQRFFHQKGILTRTTDRIEVIEMDDVTYTQNLFERFFGVGTIKITSSDSTHPVLVMIGIDNVQEVSEIIDKARRRELTRRGLRIESV